MILQVSNVPQKLTFIAIPMHLRFILCSLITLQLVIDEAYTFIELNWLEVNDDIVFLELLYSHVL